MPLLDPIDDHGLERWLGERQTLITASDVAAILGANPYVTRERIMQEKLSAKREDLTGMARIDAGNYTERGTLEWFRAYQAAGIQVWHNTERVLFKSPAMPYLGATLDGWIIDGDDTCPIEIKNIASGSVWQKVPETMLCIPESSNAHFDERSMHRPKGALVAPHMYVVQLMTQMHCAGAPYGWLVALVGGQCRYELLYRRNQRWEQDTLIPAIRSFRDELAERGLSL
jgi:putative phage-type endonuclease